MPIVPKRFEMPVQAPEIRGHNFGEVALGYDETLAVSEAQRCLSCKNQPCVSACPVNVHIPDFVRCVKEGRGCIFGNFRVIVAARGLRQSLPAGDTVREPLYSRR